MIDAINLFIKDKGADIVLLKEDAASLKYPWEILNANQYLLRGIKDDIKGIIEKGCNITGPLIVGKGTVLKSGTYIKGPVYIGENCQIGPNCFIRDFVSIGNNCRIGNAVEIKNSVISDNSKISHLSYIGDSVVGENCNLGAGVIAANVRFDKKTIFSEVKGELINTEREKLGCILGNDVHVGVNTSLMPGVLIGSGCQIGPNSLVRRNVKENTIFYTKAVDVKKKLSQNGKIL